MLISFSKFPTIALLHQSSSSSMMAYWPCSASTNKGLVDNLRKTGVIQSQAVHDVMQGVDRAQYMQTETADGVVVGPLTAYNDSPHPIGFNQTISAPHMHAHGLELGLKAIQGIQAPRILDVGAGSGYLTACLGRLVEAKGGRVFGLEVLTPLAQFAKKNMQTADGDLLDKGIVSIHVGNGWDGLGNEAPFHYIHVGAAAETIPHALMDQLANEGRLVIPVDQERGGQILVEVTRNGNTFSQRRLMNVCFVPLVRPRKLS